MLDSDLGLFTRMEVELSALRIVGRVMLLIDAATVFLLGAV